MKLYPPNLDFPQLGDTVEIHGIQHVAYSQIVWEQIDRTIRELHATCESETKWAKHYSDRCDKLETGLMAIKELIIKGDERAQRLLEIVDETLP